MQKSEFSLSRKNIDLLVVGCWLFESFLLIYRSSVLSSGVQISIGVLSPVLGYTDISDYKLFSEIYIYYVICTQLML